MGTKFKVNETVETKIGQTSKYINQNDIFIFFCFNYTLNFKKFHFIPNFQGNNKNWEKMTTCIIDVMCLFFSIYPFKDMFELTREKSNFFLKYTLKVF